MCDLRQWIWICSFDACVESSMGFDFDSLGGETFFYYYAFLLSARSYLEKVCYPMLSYESRLLFFILSYPLQGFSSTKVPSQAFTIPTHPVFFTLAATMNRAASTFAAPQNMAGPIHP